MWGMSRRKDQTAATELGDRLQELRAQAGSPSLLSVAKHLTVMLGPDDAPSHDLVRRMHHGDVDPHTVSIEALVGLARFYGVTPDQLGDVVASRLRLVRELVGQNWKIPSVGHDESSLRAA